MQSQFTETPRRDLGELLVELEGSSVHQWPGEPAHLFKLAFHYGSPIALTETPASVSVVSKMIALVYGTIIVVH